VWQGLEDNKKRWAEATAAAAAGEAVVSSPQQQGKKSGGLKVATSGSGSVDPGNVRSPMRMKSLFSPTTPTAVQKVFKKVSRSKSTTHAALRLDSGVLSPTVTSPKASAASASLTHRRGSFGGKY
ncbi:hypothetical protein HDU98_004914, partial [Podochytrium sp. JEL0797]